MFRKVLALASFHALLFTACTSPPAKPVEVLSGASEAAELALSSLKGTRDGDRVAVVAVYGEGPRNLTVHLEFRLTPQAKLERGTWVGFSGQGGVKEGSVTFLGGQSGPPSTAGDSI